MPRRNQPDTIFPQRQLRDCLPPGGVGARLGGEDRARLGAGVPCAVRRAGSLGAPSLDGGGCFGADRRILRRVPSRRRRGAAAICKCAAAAADRLDRAYSFAIGSDGCAAARLVFCAAVPAAVVAGRFYCAARAAVVLRGVLAAARAGLRAGLFRSGGAAAPAGGNGSTGAVPGARALVEGAGAAAGLRAAGRAVCAAADLGERPACGADARDAFSAL